jgi:endonuclease YncB( thermonuclease family)
MRRLLLLALLLAAVLPAAASAARKGPCVPGDASSPQCVWWNAKVTLVADGDTVRVRIPGEGTADVRFIGINAMELHHYSHSASARRGDCMGVPAANFIDRLIKGNHRRVRLAAQRASSRSGHRIRRSVWVKAHGQWIDLARTELAAGYGLFLPNGVEWAHNREYQLLAAQARVAGKNLWNPAACNGPEQDAHLQVVANWDADGADEQNINGEYVEVRNLGTAPVSLTGWWVRDSWLNWWQGRQHGTPGYRFAPGTALAPGEALRVHIGCGTETATDKHWCQRSSAFENITYDQTHMGDGAYLFDAKGDLRASFLYPCLVACSDPLQGKVKLIAHPSNPEAMAIVNVSTDPIDLGDHVWELRSRDKAHTYVFSQVFSPGRTLRPDDTLEINPPAGFKGYPDTGGAVELRTLDDQLTACADWGDRHC